MSEKTEAHEATGDGSQTRRRFLTAATSAVGVGGVAGVAVPFWVLGIRLRRRKLLVRPFARISASSRPGRWS